jgi:glycine/D-amino acid oxidase-like deaminating enzyme/nitrite reductase/ring-hydroxylating ferredoxin subunit
MRSLWLDRPLLPVTDPLPDTVDDLVVGAGLTGLTTALLLARSGRRVAVAEARHVGAVTTGNTTGKLSLLQGTKLSRMLRLQSRSVVEAYVEGNREGQQWLWRFCTDHGVPVETRDAVTYASAESEITAARNEHDAAQAVGLDVRWVDQLDVPFPFHGGTLLPDQAQFNPMNVLDALVREVHAHGGSVHEGFRVVSISKHGRPRATLDDGSSMEAENVILATGTPILDRGLYFAKVEPLRSYALAFDSTDAPDGMFLSAGSPVRSVRDAPGPEDSRLLVVGGQGHPVGRTDSELEHLDALRDWTAQHFPGAVETHAWSAQDYRSHDGIPYVGHLPRGGGHIQLATGFDKWGMTNGVAAARNMTARILGEKPSWAGPLGRRVTRPAGAFNIVRTNAGVGMAAARSLLDIDLAGAPSSPAEGEGEVGRSGVVPTGMSTVDGLTCAVAAICTHLGGVLSWNDAEKTWDCPLHGSRFAPDGGVLEGPATKPLTVRSTHPGHDARVQDV